MTDEEQFQTLCTTQFELLDIYDKHVEELVANDAPEYLFALLEKEQEQMWAELQSRIQVLSTKLYGVPKEGP